MPFTFCKTTIDGPIIIEPKVFSDARGCFLETYKYSEFSAQGVGEHFLQDNRSVSKKGVIRGLHYQLAPYAQAKIVSCVKGAIYDVAVDIRIGSPTFGRWISVILNADNKKMLYIPEGFAHGFLALSDEAIVAYKSSNEYAPECDRCIIWNDPDIAIDWQLQRFLGETQPIVSEKDQKGAFLKEAELNVHYQKGD